MEKAAFCRNFLNPMLFFVNINIYCLNIIQNFKTGIVTLKIKFSCFPVFAYCLIRAEKHGIKGVFSVCGIDMCAYTRMHMWEVQNTVSGYIIL